MKIIHNTGACYACRTCELACSWHHKSLFWPEASSIKVSRNNLTGESYWCIDSTCDSCEGEVLPLCVNLCPYGALKAVEENSNE